MQAQVDVNPVPFAEADCAVNRLDFVLVNLEQVN